MRAPTHTRFLPGIISFPGHSAFKLVYRTFVCFQLQNKTGNTFDPCPTQLLLVKYFASFPPPPIPPALPPGRRMVKRGPYSNPCPAFFSPFPFFPFSPVHSPGLRRYLPPNHCPPVSPPGFFSSPCTLHAPFPPESRLSFPCPSLVAPSHFDLSFHRILLPSQPPLPQLLFLNFLFLLLDPPPSVVGFYIPPSWLVLSEAGIPPAFAPDQAIFLDRFR